MLWYILMYYRLIYFDCRLFDFWFENKLFQFLSISMSFFRSIPDKFRSSRSQRFLKISVLKNFANFTGKHLCWSLFLIKRQLFSCEICEIFKNIFFFQNTSGCFGKLKYRKTHHSEYWRSNRLNLKNIQIFHFT